MNARVPESVFQPAQALDEVSRAWDQDIVGQLTEYIRIPAKSPMFDAQWAEHGYIDTVVRNAATWVEAQKIEGLKLEVIRLEGRTPVLFLRCRRSSGASQQDAAKAIGADRADVRPTSTSSLNSPAGANDLGPWTPKYEEGRLYGRGPAPMTATPLCQHHRHRGAEKPADGAPAHRRPD